jgi:CheY-like chemotaxis protein
LLENALQDAHVDASMYCVPDGLEALDFLSLSGRYQAAPVPNLVILDLNLPRLGGMDMLRRLRQRPGKFKVPVIILSTSQSEKERGEALDLGVEAFFSKPPSYEGLVKFAAEIDLKFLRGRTPSA